MTILSCLPSKKFGWMFKKSNQIVFFAAKTKELTFVFEVKTSLGAPHTFNYWAVN
jgi:hypothetical protein